jgi:hypothetical protein
MALGEAGQRGVGKTRYWRQNYAVWHFSWPNVPVIIQQTSVFVPHGIIAQELGYS